MHGVRRLNGAIWAFNAILAAATVVFAFQYLLFPQESDPLKGFEPVDPTRFIKNRRPIEITDDGPMRNLRNPIEKTVSATPQPTSNQSPFKAELKGTLPAFDEPKRGVAFLKSVARNTELVAYVGETIMFDGKPYDEFAGWTLVEVYKESAVFANGSQRQTIVMKEAGTPLGGPGDAGRQGRRDLNQPYSTSNFKSQLLHDSDGRQVWGMDRNEIDWALQNQENILNQDFKVSAYAGGGVKVDSVQPGSIGASRGIMPGDIIRDINGTTLSNLADMKNLLGNPSTRQQTAMRMTIERAGKPLVIEYRPLPGGKR